MSFKRTALYPVNPITARGEGTKLSSSKDKIAYANGRTVIIRDLKNPGADIAYSGHIQNATVARISPSGYYCASGDSAGNIRVWDTVGEEQVLKAEYRVISGRVTDLDWDGESKRIIAVGDGKERFGHAFMMDTGSSTGEIMGHSKVPNAVSIRQQRPYRAATAGDDTTIIFYQGPPYKYVKAIKTHTKFVQDVRYSPSGDHFVSVGSDAKVFLYDGKTGDTLAEVTDSPHSGTIYGASWSQDSKSFVTSAADGTVKLWDVEARKATTTWTLGPGLSNQQVGNTWTAGDDIVSLSISGDLNIFDKRVGTNPARVLQAPSKAVTSAISSRPGTFIAGTADGRVLSHDGESYKTIDGSGHSSYVVGITATSDGPVYSTGYDDQVREIDLKGQSFVQASCPTASQPKSIAVAKDQTVFVAEANAVEAIRSNQKVHELKPSFSPSSVAASGSIVAVGGEDQKVRLYDWDGKTLKETAVLEGNKSVISALAFSPDGSLLVSGETSGRVLLFDVKERKLITSRWSFHTARILSLAWTEDGQHCASGSLDTHVYIWSVKKPMKNISIKNAGTGGVSAVFWLSPMKLGSTGADGCVRVWDIVFHV
ncbi:hypothetical protein NLI96_g11802 [Meripilus lineatus]|uniref:Anaphase-promoting complex subunit 4 WD40 domain-containing protein n=1 Tax=Meripilus lineatus TaxID=2056292 RepID=A0AAD5UR32_9APHY|nr:hypothetical protein NLI96_g11802 [Physisporinus lineatus]